MTDALRAIAGGAFLLLQCGLVVHSRFVESRDFCWAPHTAQVHYTLRVERRGRPLSPAAIARRYRVAAPEGWEAHSYQNLINLISQYERTYGRGDGVRVLMEYRVNGRELRRWEWPSS
jgi:hypothetical protein